MHHSLTDAGRHVSAPQKDDEIALWNSFGSDKEFRTPRDAGIFLRMPEKRVRYLSQKWMYQGRMEYNAIPYRSVKHLSVINETAPFSARALFECAICKHVFLYPSMHNRELNMLSLMWVKDRTTTATIDAAGVHVKSFHNECRTVYNFMMRNREE